MVPVLRETIFHTIATFIHCDGQTHPLFLNKNFDDMIERKKTEIIEYALYAVVCLLIFGLLFLAMS
jgi:hypothetical protein